MNTDGFTLLTLRFNQQIPSKPIPWTRQSSSPSAISAPSAV